MQSNFQKTIALFLILLMAPALAEEGWFDDHRYEFQIVHGDAAEIHGLLETLVPDAHYELRGRTLVVRSSSGALDQIRELLRELDRPLGQFVVDIKVVEVTEAAVDTLWQAVEPEFFPRTSQSGTGKMSGRWFRFFPEEQHFEMLPRTAGDGGFEISSSPRLYLNIDEESHFSLSEQMARQLFQSRRVELILSFNLISDSRIKVRLGFRSAKGRRQDEFEIEDGQLLMIGKAGTSSLFLFTPHLMR